MGIAKRQWMEAEARGWSADDDRFVCARCVDEPYLRKLVAEKATSTTCSFCDDEGDRPIASPMNLLIETVATATLKRYADVDEAGTPYAEGSYIDEPIGTEEVLADMGFEAEPDVWEAVVNAFTTTDWVEAPHGSWGELSLSKELNYAWEGFCHEVRYRTRFYFHRRVHKEPQDGISSAEMMDAVGRLILRAGLVQTLEGTQDLFRGRIRRPGDDWEPNAASLGAPPPDLARSGRMNPTGIPYLYLAFDLNTMLSELGPLGPDEVIEAGVYSLPTPIAVVDFTALPPMPSLFDPSNAGRYDEVLFLHRFVREISVPVERPRLADIHYVPTQVMCEYIAQALEVPDEVEIRGIVYPSAAHRDGRNLALFPSRTFAGERFDSAVMKGTLEWTEVLERSTR